ncbi:hypothetical protein ASPCAL02261 [Aspergillus calidoustus]|uniref:Uncharacterized protein n=1 Tax=Aspergillus calidoustus TaxID=454130 RepID=A0A0U5HEW2_ASPCI|nr:hypothetical protein ASPCAL02261 [Aspergillus calidoustus]
MNKSKRRGNRSLRFYSAAEDEEGTGKDETCQAACCRRDNDMYIDRKQWTEYIDSLLPKGEHNDQQPSISILRRPLKELLRTSADGELSITPDELIIMSYRVFGFILRTRKWAQLDLSYLIEVHPRKHEPATRSRADSTGNTEAKEPTTFSRLVLNEKHKHMIVSLIAQHFRDKKSISGQREQVDIVRGKGKKHSNRRDHDADRNHRQVFDPATTWCPRCGKDIHCRGCRGALSETTLPDYLRGSWNYSERCGNCPGNQFRLGQPLGLYSVAR